MLEKWGIFCLLLRAGENREKKKRRKSLEKGGGKGGGTDDLWVCNHINFTSIIIMIR